LEAINFEAKKLMWTQQQRKSICLPDMQVNEPDFYITPVILFKEKPGER
jgi:hypothetical protein